LASPSGHASDFSAIGFLGFPKSGKTWTSALIAIGLHKQIKCKRPIQVYDSEGGFDYVREMIKEGTSHKPEGVKSQSFADLITFVKSTKPGDICIVDSVTHPWRELLKAHQNKLGRFRGIMEAKEHWTDKFTSGWYLTHPSHNIICGRAGFEFDEVEDEHGETKLLKTGTKMKTESELGFEPGLLIEMERHERRDKTLSRIAIIKGDRFGIIDGRRFEQPTYDTFQEWFSRLDLAGAGAPPIDVTPKTEDTLDGNGRSNIARQRQEREILLEETKNELTSAFPGLTSYEKKMKTDLVAECFGTRSWVALEKRYNQYPLAVVRNGLQLMRLKIKRIKGDKEAGGAETTGMTKKTKESEETKA
jgi:hypothetical protein